ncbi:MAG: sigma-70 family RNA polymerase sigma factor [Chitinophagaceae bacterium]
MGELFRMHYSYLYRYGNKICADVYLLEDAIQELFAELWQQKTAVPTISIKAYLLRALKYKLFRTLQKQHLIVNADNLPEQGYFELSHETLIIAQQEDKENAGKVIAAMNQLSDRQKEIIYLKFYQDMSYEEVAEVMNINYQAARNLLYQAIKSLRNRLSTWWLF